MHAHIITKQRPMQREAESRYVQTCLWFSPNLDFNAVFPKFLHTSMHHRVYSTLREKRTTVQRENFGKGFSLAIWRFWITLPVCQYFIPSCSQPHRYGWLAGQFTAQSIYYSSACQVKKSVTVMAIFYQGRQICTVYQTHMRRFISLEVGGQQGYVISFRYDIE